MQSFKQGLAHGRLYIHFVLLLELYSYYHSSSSRSRLRAAGMQTAQSVQCFKKMWSVSPPPHTHIYQYYGVGSRTFWGSPRPSGSDSGGRRSAKGHQLFATLSPHACRLQSQQRGQAARSQPPPPYCGEDLNPSRSQLLVCKIGSDPTLGEVHRKMPVKCWHTT
jgi:hypothetical protein